MALVAVIAWLGGCATGLWQHSVSDPQLSPSEREQVWQSHLARARSVDHWLVSGRVGVKTAQRSGSASILWQRSPGAFSIHMTGPLGRTLARLQGEGRGGQHQQVTLEVPGRAPLVSRSPERLLYRQTGWRLPFASLDFWIRGIPAPGSDYTQVLDSQGYLAELHQNGWTVSYSKYRRVRGIPLPEKIQVIRDGVQVIVAIKTWDLLAARHSDLTVTFVNS